MHERGVRLVLLIVLHHGREEVGTEHASQVRAIALLDLARGPALLHPLLRRKLLGDGAPRKETSQVALERCRGVDEAPLAL